MLEIIFVVVTFSAYLLYEKRPGHSLDIVQPHFGYSSVTETSESEQDTQPVFTTGTKQLTLDDVIGLSSKGEELVWEPKQNKAYMLRCRHHLQDNASLPTFPNPY